MSATHLTRERGFTLLEMTIALVLAAIVTFGAFRVFTTSNRTYRRGTENIDGQQNARAALTWLSKELRSAKGFNLVSPDELTLLSDKTTRNQLRTFRLDGEDQDEDGDTSELLLIRNPDDDGTPGVYVDEIAVGLDSLVFVYRDGAGQITESRAAVQEVEIFVFTTGNQMREEDAPEAHGTRQVGMSTRVKCRNLGKSVPTLGDVTPPAAPTGIVASEGCGTVTLGWSASQEPDLAGYYLSYSRGSGGSPYTGVDADQGPSPIFVGNVTTYTLTGLDKSAPYYLTVQAVDAADNISGFGSEVNVIPVDSTPPATPMNLSGRVVGNDKIQLTWTAVADWDVAWYKVRWYTDMDFATVHLDSTTTTALVLAGLERDAVHFFSVSAADDCGNESPQSSEITITMVPCDQDVDFPAVPASLDLTAGDEFVQLSWNPVADPDVVGYEVYFQSESLPNGSTLLVGNVTTYGVYGLENGTAYGFQVAALDGCGHVGGFTPLEQATPTNCADNSVPPEPPANLTAQDVGVGDRVKLSWSVGSEGDVLGYRVYWGVSAGSWDGSVDVGSNIFHTVSGLVTGTLHYFSVTAYDVCGNESGFAPSVTATPTWGCVCPPAVTTATPADFEVLQGTVPWNVTATACSTSAVAQVEFRIDDAVRYVDHAAPYEFGDFGSGWATQPETTGPHTLVAIARDENGCEAADTVNVYVDNTGVGVSCVGIADGDQGQLDGAFGEVLRVPVTNFSAVDTYQLDRVVLTWDDPVATLLAASFDGMVKWSSGGLPGAASGDTLILSSTEAVPPGGGVEMAMTFWDVSGGSPPAIDLAGTTFDVTFQGSPLAECGPYPIPVGGTCVVNVTIESVNSNKPYDVWGQPQIGDRYYTDRNYILTFLPPELEQSILVRTPNDDKNKGGSHKLVLAFDHDVTVWIAYDPRGTPPNWIKNSYVETGLDIGVSDAGTPTLGLWKVDKTAGSHTFKGNKAKGWGGNVGTNYVIFVVCR